MLAALMLLNVTLVSCGAEPTAPQGQTAEILEKLAEVTAKLAAIEAKLDAQGVTTADRLDSLEVTVTAAASGAVPLAGVDAARVDSILALASFLAVDATTASWEACGKLEFEVGAKVGIKAEGHGEGKASVGAWAGTGAFAGLVVGIKNHVEGEVGLGLPFEFGVCVPTGGEAPPVRGGAAPGSARFAQASITSSVNAALSQLGLTEDKVETAISGISAIISNGAFPSTQSLASALPLPASFSGKFSDPLGSLQAPAAARMNEAVTALCTGSYGPLVSGPITTACGHINNGPPDIGGLFTMMEQFPAVQSTLTKVDGISTTMCGRLNTIGFFSLTIPNPLSIGPTNLFGPQRLFPWFTTMSC
jgi:hypothetical protein